MLLAIATFIVGFTVLSSCSSALSDPKSFAATTLRIICNYRSTFAVISVPFAIHGQLFILLPDAWCGALAVMFVTIPGNQGGHAFLETYLHSMIVGAMLSAMIFAVYIACLLARAVVVRLAPTESP